MLCYYYVFLAVGAFTAPKHVKKNSTIDSRFFEVNTAKVCSEEQIYLFYYRFFDMSAFSSRRCSHL